MSLLAQVDELQPKARRPHFRSRSLVQKLARREAERIPGKAPRPHPYPLRPARVSKADSRPAGCCWSFQAAEVPHLFRVYFGAPAQCLATVLRRKIASRSAAGLTVSVAQLLSGRCRRLFVAKPVQMGDEIAHMCIVHRALRLRLPGIVCSLIVGEDSDDVDVVDLLEYIFRWIDKLAAKNKVQALGHKVLRWGRWQATQSRRRVKSGRPWLSQRTDNVAMDVFAPGDDTGGLSRRGVKCQPMTLAICNHSASFGCDQGSCGNVPFPGCPER